MEIKKQTIVLLVSLAVVAVVLGIGIVLYLLERKKRRKEKQLWNYPGTKIPVKAYDNEFPNWLHKVSLIGYDKDVFVSVGMLKQVRAMFEAGLSPDDAIDEIRLLQKIEEMENSEKRKQ